MNKDYRKLTELRNWDKNPRSIKKDKFEELKNRITKRGQIKPLIITPDGEVLGGNMRLRAMQELGIKEAWVSVVTPTSEADKIEIALTDNEEMGYYEDQALAELIAQYKDEIDLTKYSVHLGQSQTLEEILKQFSPDEVVEDEAPEVTENPISKLGEVYQLGRHRVMCGDSTDSGSVYLLTGGVKQDFFFGDPPYGMRLDTDYSLMHSDKSMGYAKKHKEVIGDAEDFDAGLVVPIVADIEDQIWFGADYYAHSLGETEHSGSWGVWDKRVDESMDGGFGSCFELFWSRQKRKRMIYRFQWAGFFTKGEKREYDHPTSKSVKMISKLFEDYGKESKTVLDLFLGSGSTLIACEQTNRTCYGMELDPKYCDVIRKRYAKFIDPENWESNWESMTPETGK